MDDPKKLTINELLMVEGIQRQIMGHSGDDVADDYGSDYYLHPLVEGMAMFKIPGLKLPMAWH